MKATRVLAALLGGCSLLLLAQMPESARSATARTETDREEQTLSFLIVSAEARRATFAHSEEDDALPEEEELSAE